MHPAETPAAAAQAVAARLLGTAVLRVDRIGGGRNSRVYRVVAADGGVRALKEYYRGASDVRDRLAAEFGAVNFLWRQGIRSIPQPLAADARAGFALYEYVEGTRPRAEEITAADTAAAADFLGQLKDAAGAGASENLPRASEACFSVAEWLAHLQRRLDPLRGTPAGDEIDRAMKEFLTLQFVPALERAAAAASALANGDGGLPQAYRTLSPSDFGFHNAARRASGGWCFWDFEHFGWDDPAKMISDFLLHPAMALGELPRRSFVRDLLDRFRSDRGLAARLKYVYPLCGLKWCMILLNEFLPEHLGRRRFAATLPEDRDELRRRQLDKARRMLAQVEGEYAPFPFPA